MSNSTMRHIRNLILAVLALAPALIVEPSSLLAQSVGKGLVINEIYIGSYAPTGAVATDQYIELYNPQTTTQYLDGCMIVRFGSTGGKLSGQSLLQPADAWKFPGRPGGKSLAVAPGKFIVIAASAKNFTNGLDLSSAQFETYTGTQQNDQDNANSVNLHHLGNGTGRVNDIQLSLTADAVVLTTGSDSVLTDGITASTVIDGVQYNTAWVVGNLPSSIDSGWTGGPNLKYGVAMERNTVGITKRNACYDFALQKPSPGYQHNTTPPPPPPATVKVSDLMPLDMNRYVDYNEYTTDSVGNIEPATQAHSSYTVFQTGLSFGGSSNVVMVRDTADGGPNAGGSNADIHYKATSAGDIQVFADTVFFQQMLPSGFATGLTAPNTFVDYLKMSGGENAMYSVANLSASMTYQGFPVTITISSSGKYIGVSSVTVPQGKFDSAYKFAITYTISASVNIFGGNTSLGTSTAVQSIWLVKGIGIVRTNVPTTNFVATIPLSGTTQSFPIPGTERDMVGHGLRNEARSAVSSSMMAVPSGIPVYPDPAPKAITVALPKPAAHILLYTLAGQMVRSYEVEGGKLETVLWVADIPNDPYLARIQFTDGTESLQKIIVQH